MKNRIVVFAAVIWLLAQPLTAHALGVARQLSQMIGYTIVGVGAVSEVSDSGMGAKIIKLQDGRAFQVNMLLLDPLPASEIVIFARSLTQDEINRYGGSTLKAGAILYKIMIDEEIHDATGVSE